ncbi:hypothetical protein Trydic_g13662 [Trypoxylus dichotomus]
MTSTAYGDGMPETYASGEVKSGECERVGGKRRGKPGLRLSVIVNRRNNLNALNRNNKVILTWTVGHTGIEGNKVADTFARSADGRAPLGQEPVVGIKLSNYRNFCEPGMNPQACLVQSHLYPLAEIESRN